MTLFENLKRIADYRCLTLRQIEEKANLSENALYGWKRSTPSLDKVQKVAQVLSVSLDELVEFNVEEETNPEIRRINHSLTELSEEDLDHIYDMVKSFLKNKDKGSNDKD